MAAHSSVLAWRIPWTEEPGELQSIGVTKSGTRLSDNTFTCLDLSHECMFLGFCLITTKICSDGH